VYERPKSDQIKLLPCGATPTHPAVQAHGQQNQGSKALVRKYHGMENIKET